MTDLDVIRNLRPEDFDGVTFQEAIEVFLKMPLSIRGQLRAQIIGEAKQADLDQAKVVLETRKKVEDMLTHCRMADKYFDALPPYARTEIVELINARNDNPVVDAVRGVEAWLKGERE